MSVMKRWLQLSFGLLWRTYVLYAIFAVLFALLVGKLLFANAYFLYLKPTLVYGSLALVVVIAEMGFKLNLLRALFGKRLNLSPPQWRTCIFSLALLLVTLAILNAIVAFAAPYFWVYYKVFGAPAISIAGVLVTAWVACNKNTSVA